MKSQAKFLLGIILLITFILRFPTLYTQILDVDESQYGEFALKVINGGAPYVSAVGEKPPLLYYYFIWIFQLFGNNNYYALHFITILWVMSTVIFVYLIGKERFSEKAGVAAALFYTIFSTIHEPKIISTNGETLMTLPLVAGIYFFTLYEVRSKKLFFLFLAGLFTGCGFLFRHQAGMQIGFLCIYFFIVHVLLDQTMNARKEFYKRAGGMWLLCVGWAIPPLIAGYSLYLLGEEVLSEFLYWNFSFNLQYIEAGSKIIPFKTGVIRVSLFILFTLPAWYYLLKGAKTYIPTLISKIRKRNLDSNIASYFFLLLWLVFSIVPVFIGGRFYSHYFIQVFPSLFLLAGLSASFLFDSYFGSKNKSTANHSKKVFAVLAVYAIIFFIPKVNQDFTKKMLKTISPEAAKIGVYPEQKIVGEYIKQNTNPKDKILVWGFATPIYVYADRESASRFSWTDFQSDRIPGLPLSYSLTTQAESHFKEKQNLFWQQFFEDLNKYKPVYFVDTSTGGYHEYGQYQIVKYPVLFDFIEKYYRKDATLEGMDLYRRK